MGAECSRKAASRRRVVGTIRSLVNARERMKKDRIAKKVYVGECTGNHSVGISRKRWIDTVKDCLRKRVLDVKQARRMAQDRSE